MKNLLLVIALLPWLANAGELRVLGEKTIGGFAFPESCAYDPQEKVLYVGEFGGDKLAPAEKDGKGSIAKVSLFGSVIERKVFPLAGEVLHKPKGIWIQGSRLWVTDIDSVWVFDLRQKRGRKVELPLGFANDPAV